MYNRKFETKNKMVETCTKIKQYSEKRVKMEFRWLSEL